MSSVSVAAGAQVPSRWTGPKPRRNDGRADDAVWLAERAGLILDPWEETCVRTARTTRPDGKWAAFEYGLIVPRQNGKGAVLEALELDALFQDEQTRLILHSAHEFKTAYEAFRRVVTLIENSELMSLVKRIRYTTGEEGVETLAGSRLKFVSRSSGSGRGFSGDLIILDESYNLTAAGISAMFPTLSARPNPQVVYTSSAPLPNDKSDVLRRLIRRGRAGTSSRLAFMEWAAPSDAKLDDRAAWATANPGLGIRLNEDVIEAELDAMTAEDFARERLGIWPDEAAADDEWAKRWKTGWRSCEADRSGIRDPVTLAVDVSPNRDYASIGVAGESDRGGILVEVIDHRPGTRWLVPRAAELAQKWGAKVAIGVNSPAWAFEKELKEARVPLEELSKARYAQACGVIFDAVEAGELRHLGHAELDAAVQNADRRNYDDAWVWSRRTSSVDISPLVAVTLAHDLARQHVRNVSEVIW